MDADAFNALDKLINEICVQRQLWALRTEWDNLKDDRRKLAEREQEIRVIRDSFGKIDKDAQKLAEPPLQYAIYLGRSPGTESDLIVGLGASRLEVRMKQDLLARVDELRLGQLVLLNEQKNVVAIRGEHVHGETAEVVNIIAPEGEAKVLRLNEGEPRKLTVLWHDDQELIVDYSQELAQANVPVQPGAFVQIDAEKKYALPRTKPRLHVKTAGSEGTIVEISDHLYQQGVKIGDIVRVESGLKFAFEKLPAYEIGELTLEEVPDVTYDDIGGLDDQIELIYDAIDLPYLHREQFENYQLSRPKGILLYGPPGCGKTMVAKAVANSLTRNIRQHLQTIEKYILLYQDFQAHPDDPRLAAQVNTLLPPVDSETTAPSLERFAQLLRLYDIRVEWLGAELAEVRAMKNEEKSVRSFFLNIKGPELLDKYVGETEHRIRKIFEIARTYATYYTPVVIFFDEMEAMFRTRGSGRSSDIETTIVPQFLSELDGVESTSNLIIIGASNRQDMIDPAILRPKRLDVKIKVDRPSQRAARDIFTIYLLPTLPLSSVGVSVPDTTDDPDVCVFRTAYPAYYPQPQDSVLQDAQDRRSAQAAQKTAGLLPKGCDFRLALSLSLSSLDALAQLPPQWTISDVLALEHKEQYTLPWNRLRLFKAGLEVGQLVACLRALHQRCKQDAAFERKIAQFTFQERLAEALLSRVIAWLYGTGSMVNVLTSKGNNYDWPLKDFMSGAMIANIVDRAKRLAIKRELAEKRQAQPGATEDGEEQATQRGVRLDDLRQAIEQEFAETKEQLAQQKLSNEWGRTDEGIQAVQVFLEAGESDPWNAIKLPLYRSNFTVSESR